MNNITRKPFIAAVITLLILLITGCPQSHNGGNQNNVQPNPPPPSLPPPEVQESGTGNFTKDDLFTVFGLNGQKEKITASAAAKKVKDEVISSSIFTFASREALAYDDEKGTFKVKVKGHKTADTAQTFEKTFEVKGFTHPYDKQLWGVDQSNNKGVLKLDAGIENNLTVENFIAQANVNNSVNIKNFFHNTLAFSLSDGNTIVELGDTDNYKLTAKFEKNGADKIKIVPGYIVKMRTKVENSSEETITQKEQNIRPAAQTDLVRNYFTKDDVFKYVLSKTNDDFVKADPNKFASFYYARTKSLHAVMPDLFKMEQINGYVEKYKSSATDKYLQLDIQVGIYQSSDGGMHANDLDGSLTLQYCIATTEQIENQIGNSSSTSDPIVAKSTSVTRTGFKKADTALLKNLFEFTIMPQGMDSATSNTEWSNYAMPGVPQGQFRLVSKKDNGSGYECNAFPKFDSKPFKIFVNNSDDPETVFTVDNPPYLSTGKSDVKILLTGVVLKKKAGDGELTVTYTLSDNKTIDVTYTPSF